METAHILVSSKYLFHGLKLKSLKFHLLLYLLLWMTNATDLS